MMIEDVKFLEREALANGRGVGSNLDNRHNDFCPRMASLNNLFLVGHHQLLALSASEPVPNGLS